MFKRLIVKITRRGLGVAALACCIVIAGSVAAFAVTASSHAAGPAKPVLSGATNLTVFARAATAADVLPASDASTLTSLYGSTYSPVSADARQVTANDGQTVFLVPAGINPQSPSGMPATSSASTLVSDNGMCVINTNEAFCVTPSDSAGYSQVDVCSPELPIGEMEIEWVMPDGAKSVSLGMSDGSTNSYASGSNIYIERFPTGSGDAYPTTISWTSSGVSHTVTTAVPPNVESITCAGSQAQTDARSGGHLTRSQRQRLVRVITNEKQLARNAARVRQMIDKGDLTKTMP